MAANSEKPCETKDLVAAEDTFEALATEYEFDEIIAATLATTLGCKVLRGFRYLVTTEAKIATTVLSKCGESGKKAIQGARVRRAW
jgi:hypothetical protein